MEAWARVNSGRAIWFELEGITTQKDFFLKLGKATGVARGKGFSAGKIKQRVTEFLQRTKLALIISEAQLIARRAGRDKITFKDLRAAIHDWRAPSDAALQRVFDTKPEGRRRTAAAVMATSQSSPDEPEFNEPLTAPSRGLQNRLNSPAAGHRVTLPEAVPVLTG